jgi:hypothetical protein
MVRSAASLPRSGASKLQQRSGARQEAGKLGTGNALREVLEGFSLIGNRESSQSLSRVNCRESMRCHRL